MKNTKLTIIASVLVKEGKNEFIQQEVAKIIDITRKEQGCIIYDFHQDNENPNQFLFYEIWENRELWQDHMNSNHITNFLKITEDAIENVVLNEMTHIL